MYLKISHTIKFKDLKKLSFFVQCRFNGDVAMGYQSILIIGGLY